jgi:4-hydroxy-3-methylbut-2-enyl diphosphate reductase
MGPRRAARSSRRLGAAAVLVAGVAGGLAPDVRVGDLVVASEVRGPDGTVVPCPTAELLFVDLRRLGLAVHCGPIVSTPRLAGAGGLRRLAQTGALAVDMESSWLAPPAGTPFAVVRAISDTQAQPLWRPSVVANGSSALRALRRAVPALDIWAAAAGASPQRSEVS